MTRRAITQFAPPDEMIQTPRGAKTFREWLELERERIMENHGVDSEIKDKKVGKRMCIGLVRVWRKS